MKFKIEQVALCPRNPTRAMELLEALGMKSWIKDHVVASGEVFGLSAHNEADLSFNYEALEGKELELLHYTKGMNWMGLGMQRVSHLGMHCTAEELERWREFFAMRGIVVAQEVNTESHSNPVIAGRRWYQYIIFDTYHILGVDLKFIVRKEHP